MCWSAPSCGDLNEVADLKKPGKCSGCAAWPGDRRPGEAGPLCLPALRARQVYTRPDQGPPRHRLFAIEYFNPDHHGRHKGRFFKKPDARDLEQVAGGQPPLAVA